MTAAIQPKVKQRPSIFVRSIRIDMVQIPQVIKQMERWIAERGGPYYIVFNTANDFACSLRDEAVWQAVNQSDLSVPDGMPLVLLGRMHGYGLRERVYGPDLMLRFISETADRNYSHYFFGSSEEVLTRLVTRLQRDFSGIKIAGWYAPPFRDVTAAEDEEIVNMINRASPDILWVGLGGPKQQLWMQRHKDHLKVSVMAGVGQAFDLLSGSKPQAPAIIRNNGFEWLFRLLTEPRRLWKRYLVNNSIFLYCFAGELLRVSLKKVRGLV